MYWIWITNVHIFTLLILLQFNCLIFNKFHHIVYDTYIETVLCSSVLIESSDNFSFIKCNLCYWIQIYLFIAALNLSIIIQLPDISMLLIDISKIKCHQRYSLASQSLPGKCMVMSSNPGTPLPSQNIKGSKKNPSISILTEAIPLILPWFSSSQ